MLVSRFLAAVWRSGFVNYQTCFIYFLRCLYYDYESKFEALPTLSARFPDASAASQNPPRAAKQSQLRFVFVCGHFASHIDLHCKLQERIVHLKNLVWTNCVLKFQPNPILFIKQLKVKTVETLDHFSSYLLGLVPSPFCLRIIRQSGADLSWSQNDFPSKHVMKISMHQSLTFRRFEVINLWNASQLCKMANICI